MAAVLFAALMALALTGCASSPPVMESTAGAANASDGHSWQAPGEISVLTWNLGFGGLGEEADFFPDGGRRLIPSSRRQVLRYVEGIAGFVQSVGADVFLFQEAARPSVVNRRVDLVAELAARLPGRWCAYSPEFEVLFPKLSVGAATFAPGPPGALERLELPRGGASRRQAFHLLVSRFPVGRGELVLANLHLSAFDAEGQLRALQLERVTAFLLEEACRGAHVVLGGDWNLLLADSAFPHTTEEKHLQWVQPLPQDFPPAGWRFAVDETVPTVRTLERPFAQGENYTAVIDGFLVSPNVEVLAVRAFDLGFRFSDHQPVLLRLRLN